ncbi:UNVERIFIED_ORG: hypothetical protein ABIB19_003755 [Arthrobacter sp. UYEF10]
MKLKTLVFTTVATAASAAAGGVATDPGSSWYLRLRKPGWQPPAIAFPVVWTALYADLALTSAVALECWGGCGSTRRRVRQTAGNPRLSWRPGRKPYSQCCMELAFLALPPAMAGRGGMRCAGSQQRGPGP